MKLHRSAGLLATLMTGALFGAQGNSVSAQTTATPDAVSAPAAKTIGIPAARKYSAALIVLNARGAQLAGHTLTLDGVAASAILFASRPVRSAGHLPTSELVDLWTSGSFAKDAPNATISVFRKDGSGVSDAVLVLKAPKIMAGKLSFDVDMLEGSLANADGPVALFIDTVWFGLGSGGFTYLGSSRTKSADTYPAVGSPSDPPAFTGWARPAPDGPPSYRNQYNPPGLAVPPDAGGYKPPCGKPPLLPCY